MPGSRPRTFCFATAGIVMVLSWLARPFEGRQATGKAGPFKELVSFQFDSAIRTICFLPTSGSTVLFAATPYVGKLLDFQSEKELNVKAVDYPEVAFRSARFSADGRLLAYAYNGTTAGIGVIDVRSWREPYPRMRLPKERFIDGFAFSLNGSYIVSFGSPNHVTFWQRAEKGYSEDQKTLHVFGVPRQRVRSVEFSADGKWMAVGGTASVSLWMLKAGQVADVLWRQDGPCSLLGFSRDGSELYRLDASSRLDVLSVENGKHLRTLFKPESEADHERIGAFRVLLNHTIMTVGGSGEVVQWDPRSGKRIHSDTPLGKNVDLRALDVSPDGKHFAVGTETGKLTVFQVPASTE